MPPTLLAIAAPPASGKTEIARELAAHYGFKNVSASGLIRRSHATLDPATHPPLATRADVQEYQRLWREREGLDAVAAAVLRTQEQMGANARVCFDGLRNRHDAERIRQSQGIIIALQCSLEERYARFIRRENRPGLTLEAFEKEEAVEYESNEETGLHLREVMKNATVRIDSSQTIREVMRDLLRALRKIGVDFD